jgi:Photosynthetic reaction centre cytochrome C subunit
MARRLLSNPLLPMTAVLATLLIMLRVEGADQAVSPRPPPIVFKNLQALPKGIKREQLDVVMNRFSTGLGVDCNFCHATAKLPPGKTLAPGADPLDYSLDDKPTKRTARQMIAMVSTINAMVPAAIGKAAESTVSIQCYNCHRGLSKPPLPIADILDQRTAEIGLNGAIAYYKDLRAKKLGSGEYDFGDTTMANGASRGLAGYAFQLVLQGKSDDALKWLNVNLEYFPKSADSWGVMALVQGVGKHDRLAAIASLKKAIALDPEEPQFKGYLKAMETAPP